MASALDTQLVTAFRLNYHLGSGSFGDVYLGIEPRTNRKIAMKIEAKARFPVSMLKHEADMLMELQGVHGIVRIYMFYRLINHHAITMEILGSNLDNLLHRQISHTFSIKTVLMIAMQMIDRLHCIHSRGILHRDLKPANMAIGLGDKERTVHLLDFGLAKKYRIAAPTAPHIPYKEGQTPHGTFNFMSLRTHCGVESSRRDDLESLGYVLLYMLRGKLPWSGFTDINNLPANVYQCKANTSLNELCKGLPSVFHDFLECSRNMGFEEEPDYDKLKNMFLHSYDYIHVFPHDDEFDWNVSSDSKKKSKIAGCLGNLFCGKN